MRFFSARRLALVAFLPVLSALAIIPGCADQGEGERCGTATVGNDDDCSGGLTCKNISNGSSEANFRCCSDTSSEPRCIPTNGVAGSGAGGGAGTSGAGGAGRAGAGGSSAGSSGEAETEAGAAPESQAGAAGAI